MPLQAYILNYYVHKSSLGDSSSLPITSKEWRSDDPKFCGSDGTVQVKCTKVNGEPLQAICTRLSKSEVVSSMISFRSKYFGL